MEQKDREQVGIRQLQGEEETIPDINRYLQLTATCWTVRTHFVSKYFRFSVYTSDFRLNLRQQDVHYVMQVL
jgi:hypothetical protein